MSNIRPIDRETGYLLPPSVDEWLPEKHLASAVAGAVGLWLSDRGIFEQQARAGDV